MTLYRVTYIFMGTSWTKRETIDDILRELEDDQPDLLMQAVIRVLISRRKRGRRRFGAYYVQWEKL